MKVSAMVLATLVSWVVAYPGLLEWQGKADNPLGYVITGNRNDEVRDNLIETRAVENDTVHGLIENIGTWLSGLNLLWLFDREKVDEEKEIHGENKAGVSLIERIFGKDTPLGSIISNGVATIGKVMENIRNNFKGNNTTPP